MTTYNWDLIERLLHEVQNGEGSFAPRKYAEQEAAEKVMAGESTGNLDALKKTAADYEALLFKRGFIESRPEEEGGNGENFILTALGAQLLALIDSSIIQAHQQASGATPHPTPGEALVSTFRCRAPCRQR